MSALFLGVDGGNTKTLALVVNDLGEVVGAAAAGCADIHNAASPEAAITEICTAAGRALENAGVTASAVTAATFSLAGADWPEDFELLHQELQNRLGFGEQLEVVNDAVGALRAGTDDGVGVSVVCGTYGAVGARNASGELFHLGFWPDSTGAYALGSAALAAIWRSMLGLAPSTSLTERALERWSCDDALELLHAFTRRIGPLPEAERSLFADAVLDEAEAGDDVARTIVREAGGRLGDYARVCARKTGQLGQQIPLVLSGGVLRHRSTVLREAILERLPEGVPLYPAAQPVVGAVLLAADRLGVALEVKLRGAEELSILQGVVG